MKRKFGGLEAQKFQFDVIIGEMRGGSKLDGQELAVCWTRGAKIASTKNVTCDGAGTATWDENLSLICTMYRSANGTYQEKKAKLAVREKKKKKTVGKVHFDLAEYISQDGSKTVTMPLEVSTGVFSSNEASGSLSLTVGCRFIPPGDAGEYSEMTAMDASEVSTQSDLCDEEDTEEPVPVGAAKSITPAQAAALKSNSSKRSNLIGAEGLMGSGITPETESLKSELEEMRSSRAKLQDQLDGAEDEVKRLRKSNYNLQDSLARQGNDSESADSTKRVAELEAALEEERIAKEAAEKQLRELKESSGSSSVAGSAEEHEQVAQLIEALVEAKMAYANSEEEKGNLGLKLVQLRRALAKEREINQQVSQRMTRLEVKAEKLKHKGSAGEGK